MEKILIKQFTGNPENFLKQVAAGKTIIILDGGKIIAKLVPPDYSTIAAREKLEQLQKTAVVGDVLSPIETEFVSN